MSHAGSLWGLLLMQTSSSSRQPVVWTPQGSRYLLAWASAVKFTAKLGLWPGHPQLGPFLHWAPVQEERRSAHHLRSVKRGSLSVCWATDSEGFLGGRGYYSFLMRIPVQAGDLHQHIKWSVMWMFIRLKSLRSWDGIDFHCKSSTNDLSSPASRVCIQKHKMWWIGFIYVVLVWAFPLSQLGHCL